MNRIATAKITQPVSYAGNSLMRFLATFVQKIITGTTMSNIVTTRDLASGPKISLPLKRNICNDTKTNNQD